MTCEDCGFEFTDGKACPRCGCDSTVNLILCAETENPPVFNRTEAEFNALCQKTEAEGGDKSKLRQRMSEINAAAKKGDFDARHMMSHIALARKELDAAHRILAGLADAGHALGQLDLARLYEEGIGVEANAYDAIKLYRLSAAQGNPIALFKLAEQYGGKGTLKPRPDLANAIMEKLVARHPDMFQRKPSCQQGGCDCTKKAPSTEQFAVQSAFQMSRMIKYLVLLGTVGFIVWVVWTEFLAK